MKLFTCLFWGLVEVAQTLSRPFDKYPRSSSIALFFPGAAGAGGQYGVLRKKKVCSMSVLTNDLLYESGTKSEPKMCHK